VVPKKLQVITQAWRLALQGRSFRLKIGATFMLLILCAVASPFIFQFIQERPGVVLNDFVLEHLPTLNLSVGIFFILYALIIWAIFFLSQNPNLFLHTLQAYVLLTLFRFISLLLTPLEPPTSIEVLSDPFVQYLFYQNIITKDLFFSGHTSLLVLLTLAMPNGSMRKIFLVGSIAVAVMLLFQHAHYTVDIAFAPLFSWLAIAAVRLFLRES
jgi:hypothetical protein